MKNINLTLAFIAIVGLISTGCSSSSKKEADTASTPSEAKDAATPELVVVKRTAQELLSDAIKSQKEDAIYKAATDVLASSPSDVKALNAMGLLHLRRGQPFAAQYFFNKALEKNQSAELYNNRGLALLAALDQKEAIRSFRKALEINPKEISAASNLAAIYAQSRDFNKVANLLEPLSAKIKKDFKTLNNLAIAYANTKRESLAEGLYTEALAASPQSKEILYNQAVLYVERMHQMEKGQEKIAQLKSLSPSDGMKSKINELENKAKAGVK